MKKLIFYIVLLMTFAVNADPSAIPSSGVIKRFEDFHSEFISSRTIDVWLPEDYSYDQKYDVLYMHDGNMLFDSSDTWNNQEWKLDEAAAKLMKEGKVKPFIVVGIWNAGKKRYPEYFPEKVYRELSLLDRTIIKTKLAFQSKSFAPIGDFFYGDNYVRFLANEVVPFIEKNFNVHSGPAHRFVGGSSMGGLMSWYALLERPDVFGGAIAMSTHWPGMYDVDNPFPKGFEDYIRKNINKLDGHKVYFDLGDQTLDAVYPPLQKRIDAIFAASYPNDLWKTEFFPGHKHDEVSWASRIHLPLMFMFGNEEQE